MLEFYPPSFSSLKYGRHVFLKNGGGKFVPKVAITCVGVHMTRILGHTPF